MKGGGQTLWVNKRRAPLYSSRAIYDDNDYAEKLKKIVLVDKTGGFSAIVALCTLPMRAR